MPQNRTIGFTLRCLSNQFRRCVETLNAGIGVHGLSGIQSWTLGYLAHHAQEPVYQYMMENAFEVRRSTMTEILNGMERNGLISRVQDEQDGRKKRIVLTSLGSSLQQEMHSFLQRLEADAAEGISQEELNAFYSVSDKISQNLERKYRNDGGNNRAERNE